MGEEGGVREDLLRFVRRKFSSFSDIELASEDIVGQAFLNVLRGGRGEELIGNFAYMSKVCERVAFRVYRSKRDAGARARAGIEIEAVQGAEDQAQALLDGEAVEAIATSLETLREIERIIVEQRYYRFSTFQEIARNTGIKLNTVLSHHRRALEKLRPRLAVYFDELVEGESGKAFGGSRGRIRKFF